MLTVAECIAYIDENLGGDAVVVEQLRILNTVGELLFGMRSWEWLQRGPVLLDTVQDQPYIDLPAGFRSIVTLQSNQILDISIVPPETFVSIVRNSGLTPPVFAVALNYQDDNGGVKPVLSIYPTPGESEEGVMNLWYMAGWETLVQADIDDNEGAKQIRVPSWIEPLFFEIMQAVLRGFEEDDNAGMSARMEAVQRGPIFAAALRRDSATGRVLGMLPERRALGKANKLHLIEYPEA